MTAGQGTDPGSSDSGGTSPGSTSPGNTGFSRPRRHHGRLVALLAFVVAVVAAAGGYLAYRVEAQRSIADTAPPEARVAGLAELLAGPRIVFRSTALDSTYGRVAVVALADPGGPRAATDLECDRVYATAEAGLCLAADRGALTTYRQLELDASLAVTAQAPLSGLPSRARLSDDAALRATTTFVTGHSYAAVGFSTETVVTRMGGESYGNLEDFELVVDGETVTAPDRNIWGVTFAAGDVFYATAAVADVTWLVRGNLSQRRLEAVATDAECPSLSPDGVTLVYKKREGAPAGRWRLVARDVASGRERSLPETRSVDDQVAWLDDTRIVYGIPREGSDAASSDIWVLDTATPDESDGTDAPATPTVLVPQAWSPAVIAGA